MDYQGYFTKEELLTRIELAFPFVPRPPDSELFAYDNNDLMCKIIKDRISTYTGEVIPYEGVIYLYGEVGSLTFKGMQWLLPSLLRVMFKSIDRSGNLHLFLNYFFENTSVEQLPSAYNYSWLNSQQAKVLLSVLEYISETFGLATAYAQENLSSLSKA